MPIQIDRSGISFIPFAIGACGFMWLLISDSIDRVRLFGRRFTGDGRGVDAWETSPLSSIGRRIATVGVVLAIAVPVILPDIGPGLFSGIGGRGGGDGSGNCKSVCPHSNQVNLFAGLEGSLNKVKPTNEATVTTNDPNPFYLRYAVAGDLEKDGFHESVPDGSTSQPDPPQSAGVTYDRYTATVKVQAFASPFLPDYYNTVYQSLSGVSPDIWHYNDDTMAIYGPDGASPAGDAYSFTYNALDLSDRNILRNASRLPASDPIAIKYSTVPENIPAVTAWDEEYASGTTNEFDTVTALYQSLGAKNNFTYKLSTTTGTTGSDIGDFLQRRQGSCAVRGRPRLAHPR